MSAEVIQLSPRAALMSRRTAAQPADLIVGRLLSGSRDFYVLSVAEVDGDGFVSTCLNLDGRRYGVGRIFDLSEPYFIAAARTLTAPGLADLPGLSAADLDDIKAEFRRYAAVQA